MDYRFNLRRFDSIRRNLTHVLRQFWLWYSRVTLIRTYRWHDIIIVYDNEVFLCRKFASFSCALCAQSSNFPFMIRRVENSKGTIKGHERVIIMCRMWSWLIAHCAKFVFTTKIIMAYRVVATWPRLKKSSSFISWPYIILICWQTMQGEVL